MRFPKKPLSGSKEIKIDGKPVIFVIMNGIVSLKDELYAGKHYVEYAYIPSSPLRDPKTGALLSRFSRRQYFKNF